MSEHVPGQLDALDELERQEFAVALRRIYDSSGAVFDTQLCRDGEHSKCAGLVDVKTGQACSARCVGPHVGPCRCDCHDA